MNIFATTEVTLLVVMAISVFAVGLSCYALLEFRATRRLYREFMRGTTAGNLEDLLIAFGERTQNLEDGAKKQAEHGRDLDRRLQLAVQRVGMIRFDAYTDTGGELSFALALLDAADNGVVISSLYGRSDARTYAKPIIGGKSTFALSGEETAAIAQAKKL